MKLPNLENNAEFLCSNLKCDEQLSIHYAKHPYVGDGENTESAKRFSSYSNYHALLKIEIK